MAKEKAPHMPWYGREFYSDENVVVMTLEQEGAYLRLLWNCWQEGSIPADTAKLAAICKNTPARKFDRDIWPALQGCFAAAEDGRLAHRKVETLRASKDNFRTECSEAGKRGASIRWNKKNGVLIGYPIQTPKTLDGVDIAADCRLPNTSLFDEFRAVYPVPKRDVKVELSRKAYIARIGGNRAEHQTLMEGLARHIESEQWLRSLADDGGRFIPSMERFINQEVYSDHPPKSGEHAGPSATPKYFDGSYLKAGLEEETEVQRGDI